MNRPDRPLLLPRKVWPPLLCWLGPALVLAWGTTGLLAADPPAIPKWSPQLRLQLAKRDQLIQKSLQLRIEDKLGETLAEAQKGLAIVKEVFGPCLDPTTRTWEQVVRLQTENEQLPAARRMLKGLVAARVKAYGDRHWQVADVRRIQADLEAVAKWDRAKRKRYRQAGRPAAQVVVLAGKGANADAVKAAAKIVEMRQDLWGKKHPNYAGSLLHLGRLQRRLRDFAGASDSLQEASRVYEKALGGDHPLVALCLFEVGSLHDDQKDYAPAADFLERAAQLYEKTIGKENKNYIQCLDSLGWVYRLNKNGVLAEKRLRELVRITPKVFGEESGQAGYAARQLGGWLLDKGDLAGAEPFLKRAAQIAAKTGGKKQAGYLRAVEDLVFLYRRQNDTRRAEALLREVLPLHKELNGVDSRDYSEAALHLGWLLEARKDYANAKPLLFHVAGYLAKQKGGIKTRKYMLCMESLARTYAGLADYPRAKDAYRKALDVAKKVLDEKDPFIVVLLNELGSYAWEQKL